MHQIDICVLCSISVNGTINLSAKSTFDSQGRSDGQPTTKKSGSFNAPGLSISRYAFANTLLAYSITSATPPLPAPGFGILFGCLHIGLKSFPYRHILQIFAMVLFSNGVAPHSFTHSLRGYFAAHIVKYTAHEQENTISLPDFANAFDQRVY